MRDNCLMIGPAAQWAMETGAGREITREEMLELLDRADRDGLVLEPENTKSPCSCAAAAAVVAAS